MFRRFLATVLFLTDPKFARKVVECSALDRKLSLELIESDPPVGYSGRVETVQVQRVTTTLDASRAHGYTEETVRSYTPFTDTMYECIIVHCHAPTRLPSYLKKASPTPIPQTSVCYSSSYTPLGQVIRGALCGFRSRCQCSSARRLQVCTLHITHTCNKQSHRFCLCLCLFRLRRYKLRENLANLGTGYFGDDEVFYASVPVHLVQVR